MEFLVSGLNHRTADLELRDRLAVTEGQEADILERLKGHLGQAVVLSTCNRSEFYTLADDSHTGDRLLGFLCHYFGLSLEELSPHMYTYQGEGCVRHLFRVASGLDSMILGESQVLGQVRDAFASATKAGAVRGPLSRLFHQSLRVGKRVRTETDLGRHSLSVSRACVELARSALGSLEGRRGLVIGAGEAGKLAARAMVKAGVRDIMVANRTYQRGEELARDLGGQAIPFALLPQALAEVDIVIGATGAPGFVLGMEEVARAMERRDGRSVLLMDIAVPRDFDPSVREIPGVILYDTDDLDDVARVHTRELEAAARKAEALVDDEVRQFMKWWESMEVLPTIAALHQQAEAIRQQELSKTLKKLSRLTPEELESVDSLTRAIVNKLLHNPIDLLKEQRNPHHIQVARKLFRIEEG